MRNSWAALISVVLVLSCACSQRPTQNPETEALDKLAGDVWTWRAKYAPFTDDDVNRIERPGGVRDWSAAKIDNSQRTGVERRHGTCGREPRKISTAASGKTAVASKRNGAWSGRLHIFSHKCGVDPLLAGGTFGHGSAGMESRGRVRSI